jgi:hypothetical protein
MALTVEIGEDGSLAYKSDGHVVLTGPIQGHVTTEDGTRYHVGPDVIEVASQAHAVEVANLIGARHANEGHPSHDDAVPFVHTPTSLADARVGDVTSEV